MKTVQDWEINKQSKQKERYEKEKEQIRIKNMYF